MKPDSVKKNLALHECLFKSDLVNLSSILHSCTDKKGLIETQDKHGNTPLHLAVMMGKKDQINLLLAHGASVKSKNKQGWSPLQEAVSYGDRQIIALLLRKMKEQSKEHFKMRKQLVIEGLKKMEDYELLVRWDFISWLPLVSKMLPSDICKLSKKGASIRLDTTLVDFSEMHWERGDITFIYKGDTGNKDVSLHVLDNSLKVFQRVHTEESEKEFEEEIDMLMSGDIVSAQMSTKPVSFAKAQSGWIFKEDRYELVGSYNATFYVINGLTLESKKRREHLSLEDLERNKTMFENFSKGTLNPHETSKQKTSLPSPEKHVCSFEEYMDAHINAYTTIGRQQICKKSSKTFKATIGMSEEFPLTMEMFLDLLEVIAPQFKHFKKLKDFVKLKLPPGFPVKADIPVLPTVSGRITFQDFCWKQDLDAGLFDIPFDYTEDPTRFPDL